MLDYFLHGGAIESSPLQVLGTWSLKLIDFGHRLTQTKSRRGHSSIEVAFFLKIGSHLLLMRSDDRFLIPSIITHGTLINGPIGISQDCSIFSDWP